MAIEFNLLYRWHGLIPTKLRVGGADEPIWQHDLQPGAGRRARGRAAVRGRVAPARRPGRRCCNTEPALREVELASRSARRAPSQLAPYNDYRELAKFPRVTDFDQITGDPVVQDGLRDLYGDVDRIEFFAGLFAEDARPNSVLPSLIGRMVGVDAFSQALTNPLLAPRVFNEQTFSPLGMEIIGATRPALGHPAPQRPGEPRAALRDDDPRGLGARLSDREGRVADDPVAAVLLGPI